jgi:hypothetical protein
MENSGTGGQEDRIAALENKCREMDALVKGVLNELLDLKSQNKNMSRQVAEYRSRELEQEPVMQDVAPAAPVATTPEGSVVIRPKGERKPDVPAAPEEPVMVRIMQSDGTFKMEPRRGSESTTYTSPGYGRNRKK